MFIVYVLILVVFGQVDLIKVYPNQKMPQI